MKHSVVMTIPSKCTLITVASNYCTRYTLNIHTFCTSKRTVIYATFTTSSPGFRWYSSLNQCQSDKELLKATKESNQLTCEWSYKLTTLWRYTNVCIIITIIIIIDPGTQFPGKKNYAMQRQNTKTSWNGLYSSSSFTKLSRSRIARHVSFMRICDYRIFGTLPHFSHILAKRAYRIFFRINWHFRRH